MKVLLAVASRHGSTREIAGASPMNCARQAWTLTFERQRQ